MKFLHRSLLLFGALCSVNMMFAAGINYFTGQWVNQDAAVPKLSIIEESDGVYVQAWGKCGTEICDWGIVEAEAYGLISQGNNNTTLTATFEREDRQVLLVLSSDGVKIEAKMVSMNNFGLGTEHAIFSYAKEKRGEAVNEAAKTSSLGSISGEAMGMAKTTASIFHISLYGPNNPNLVQGMQYFSTDRTYSFDELEDGTYWLIIDSRASTGVQAFPDYQEIVIREGKAYHQNVELK